MECPSFLPTASACRRNLELAIVLQQRHLVELVISIFFNVIVLQESRVVVVVLSIG
jgi:hypothetical protein